jgi:DNA-binding YbaB/EbfC family protein
MECEMKENPLDIVRKMQKLQDGIGDLQTKLGRMTVQGSAGGGMVVVEMNGNSEVTSVHLDPETVAAGDIQMLEDLIASAVHAALEKAKQLAAGETLRMAASMGIPPDTFANRL